MRSQSFGCNYASDTGHDALCLSPEAPWPAVYNVHPQPPCCNSHRHSWLFPEPLLCQCHTFSVLKKCIQNISGQIGRYVGVASIILVITQEVFFLYLLSYLATFDLVKQTDLWKMQNCPSATTVQPFIQQITQHITPAQHSSPSHIKKVSPNLLSYVNLLSISNLSSTATIMVCLVRLFEKFIIKQ